MYFMLKEVYSVIVRYCLAVGLFLLSGAFYVILKPLTFYASYFVTNIFTEAALVSDTVFRIGSEEFLFVPACAAVSAYLLLFALVLLTRGISFRLGLKIALLGSLVIFIVNIVRIEVLLFVLLKYGKDYFQTLHLLIWKIFSSLFVALLWIFFVKRYKIKGIPVYDDLRSFARKR